MQDQITDNNENIGALGAAAVAGKNAPVAVGGLTLLGVDLQDWVVALSAVWLVLQIAWFVYEKWRKINRDMDDNQP